MRELAAIILSAAALVMFSEAAEARRLSVSVGRSVSKPVVPVSKSVAAPNSSAAQSRSTTLIVVGTGQNRPMAAAPRTPVPERGPLHEIASVMDQTSPVPERSAEPAVVAEPQPESPVVQTAPVFVTMASPPKSLEKIVASAQPARTVYCAVQARGGCAPF
jgi:hypothetical protein